MTKPTDARRSGPRAPQQGRSTARPTRAQIQAMEARAAGPAQPAAVGELEGKLAVEPLALDFASVNAPAASPTPTTEPRAVGALPARARRRAAQPVILLSRDEEYAYIRGDMRRLLSIAGGLLALMVVLLFVVRQ